MYVRPKLTFVSFFMFFFAPSPNKYIGRNFELLIRLSENLLMLPSPEMLKIINMSVTNATKKIKAVNKDLSSYVLFLFDLEYEGLFSRLIPTVDQKIRL